MKSAQWVLTSFFFLVAVGCSNSGERFEPPLLDECTIPASLSQACIPIQVSLKDLEQKINRSLTANAYQSNRTVSGREVKVAPNGRIKIFGIGKQVEFVVPVKMRVDISEKIDLGEVEFAVDFIVRSNITIDKKWKLHSKSKVEEIRWDREPIVEVLGFTINLKKQVENALQESKDLVSNRIDEVVRRKVDLKKHLVKIWRSMQRHHNVLRQQNDSLYLIIKPREFFYSSHRFQGENLVINSRLNASTSLMSWLTSEDSLWVTLPKLKFDKGECENFKLTLVAHIRHEDLNKSLNNRIAEYVTEFQGYRVLLESIETKTSGRMMLMKLRTGGELKGLLTATLSVLLDTTKKHVKLKIESLEVTEGSYGMEAAEFLFGDVLKNYIERYSGFHYGSWLKQVPKFIQVGVKQGRSGDKWRPEFSEMETEVLKIQMTKIGIHLALQASGKGSVVVEKLR